MFLKLILMNNTLNLKDTTKDYKYILAKAIIYIFLKDIDYLNILNGFK